MQQVIGPRRGLVVDAEGKEADTEESRRRDGAQAWGRIQDHASNKASIYVTFGGRRCAVLANTKSADAQQLVSTKLIDVLRGKSGG